MELTQEQLKGWHLLFNDHHRSGIWGVIASQKTGAIGGIRLDWIYSLEGDMRHRFATC